MAHGPIGETEIEALRQRTSRRNILWDDLDAGDAKAGSIRCTQRTANDKERNAYRIRVNKNHTPPVRFATLAHELGHLFLGHLGLDQALSVPDRRDLSHRQVELEAESIAFIVCKRNGVTSKSETYLANFVTENSTIDHLDIYQVMRAAFQFGEGYGRERSSRTSSGRHASSIRRRKRSGIVSRARGIAISVRPKLPVNVRERWPCR